MRPRWLAGVLLGTAPHARQSRGILPGTRHRPSSPSGWAVSSIPRSRGKTSHGYANAGPASSFVKGIMDRGRRAPRAERPESMRSSCPTTAAGSSTAPRRRSPRCRTCVDAVAGRCEVLLDGGITIGPGRAQGVGARRARLPHRQGVSLRTRRAGRRRRHARAGADSPRARSVSMALCRRRTTSRARRCATCWCTRPRGDQPARRLSNSSTSVIRAIATSDAGRFSSDDRARLAPAPRQPVEQHREPRAVRARDTAQSTTIRSARELSSTSMPSWRASRAVANVSSPVTTTRPGAGSLIPMRTLLASLPGSSLRSS